jgi:hypothetical protein
MIDDRTQHRLEELQADILLETGTRVTQGEILSVLIEQAYTSRGEFLSLFRSTSLPLTESERAAFHANPVAVDDAEDGPALEEHDETEHEDEADTEETEKDDSDPDEVLYA